MFKDGDKLFTTITKGWDMTFEEKQKEFLDLFYDEKGKQWNPELLANPSIARYLAQWCSFYIECWFDPEHYPWKEESYMLATYCSHAFDLWWDPDKFEWISGTIGLIRACGHMIETWWDPDKFNWFYGYLLLQKRFDFFPRWKEDAYDRGYLNGACHDRQ